MYPSPETINLNQGQNPKEIEMCKEEEVMEALGTARYEWLMASKLYAKSIHSVLTRYGADFPRIRLMNMPLEAVSIGDQYDFDVMCANPAIGPSPLVCSQLIRLVEVSSECGGVLPEGILPREANPVAK